jgi:hypothetical protein
MSERRYASATSHFHETSSSSVVMKMCERPKRANATERPGSGLWT